MEGWFMSPWGSGIGANMLPMLSYRPSGTQRCLDTNSRTRYRVLENIRHQPRMGMAAKRSLVVLCEHAEKPL